MPTYAYRCKGCNHEFEKISKIADRKEPESQPCPECNEVKVEHTLTPVAMSYQTKGVVAQASHGWNDVLTKIKSQSGSKNTINVK